MLKFICNWQTAYILYVCNLLVTARLRLPCKIWQIAISFTKRLVKKSRQKYKKLGNISHIVLGALR